MYKLRKNLILSVLCAFLLICSVNGYAPSTQWCYRCVSTHPGCAEPFNWWWYWSQACPEKGDKCVKIVERKGGNEVITRDCLSALFHRTDIPADHYEGCRSSSKDVHLGNYVNNSIKELDIKRDYYDETTFCFCYFDNRCNSGYMLTTSISVLFISIFGLILAF